MIGLGESVSNIPFLTGKLFIHRTEKYTMLVMSTLWRSFNGIVVTMHRFLS